MKSKLPVIALLLIALNCGHALMPSRAHACYCAPPATPQGGLQRADAVFTGKVLSITPASQPYVRGRAVLEVISTWKGAVGREVQLIAGGTSADCGYTLTQGSTYLVYADSYVQTFSLNIGNINISLPLGESKLGVSICNRTNLIANAAHDLAALGPGSPAAQDGFLEKLKDSLPYLLLASLLAAGFLYYRLRRLKARGHSE